MSTRPPPSFDDLRRYTVGNPDKAWAPDSPGEYLRGSFEGFRTLSGRHGPFEAAVIRTKKYDRLVGGEHLHALLQRAGVRRGETVGVVFCGWADARREFDLYTAGRPDPHRSE